MSAAMVIPEDELEFRFSRSSGPGGQNVNKVESRVEVMWDVASTSALDEDQRVLLMERLATRITKAGILRVVSQKHRTQAANRDAARLKLEELVAGALVRRPRRKRVRVSKAAKRRRLENKRRRSQIKRSRGRVDDH
ncbi:MAG: alternative ribosome rescue aminoacyl-tRNA hydrolase ArfB [Acidobacteriota bacterium]